MGQREIIFKSGMEAAAMISERKFAESYKTFWDEATPHLSFYCSTPEARGRRFGQAIEIPEKGFHISLNNIIATTHFRNISADPDYPLEQSYRDSIPVLNIFSANHAKGYELTRDYREIILTQTERLASQYEGKLVHDPPFPGYGILANCRGDLLCGSTLVEIKANAGRRYNKPFENRDFRQLIVYCALNYLAGHKYRISMINLFNPRMGFVWQSDHGGVCIPCYRVYKRSTVPCHGGISPCPFRIGDDR